MTKIKRLFRQESAITNSSINGSDSHELEELLTSQLAEKPKSASLRVRLVRLYIDTERVNEAFEHVTDVEKRLPYVDELDWYRCVLDVLQVSTAASSTCCRSVPLRPRRAAGQYRCVLDAPLNGLYCVL